MGKPNLKLSDVKSQLAYDPQTGLFTRLVSNSNTVSVGDVAGNFSSEYVTIRVCGQSVPAHRLAFLFMTGEWPENYVDHKNRDTQDNRWRNLREATVSQNAANAAMHVDNSSGFKGVHRHGNGLWRAQICHKGKRHCLGVHETPAEAHAAYISASKKLNGEFACDGGSHRKT